MSDLEYLFNFEILLTFSSLIDGKAKRLPYIYNFREMENKKVGISNKNINRKIITGTLNKCSLDLKRLAENQCNKDGFLNLIDDAVGKLMEYHLIHYSNSISKKSNTQTNNKNIRLYLSKLKQKILNPRSLINILKPRSNSFPLDDAKTIKEFKIIDNTLKNWINNSNTTIPIS